MNKHRLYLIRNMYLGMAYEIVAVCCGLVLPRLILSGFGSEYNGIVSSITQFLSLVTVVRSGIGGVTKVHLYQSLAKSDNMQTSVIMKSTNRFMRVVSVVYILGLLLFASLFSVFEIKSFDFIFTFSLVLIIGFSTLCENMFGYSSQIILQADQREYIISIANIATVILNTGVAALLINAGISIHIVKLGSSLVFAAKPVFLFVYTRKKYKINDIVKPDMSLLKQRKDAVAHAIAEFIHINTDVIVLTLLTSSLEVSVYAVYNIIINGLRKLIRGLCSGFESLLGDLNARGEDNIFFTSFKCFEFLIMLLSTVIFTCCIVLLEPFIIIYTKGITDANYSRPVFAVLISVAEFFYSIRLPYQFVIRISGKFKETKKYSVIEACINIILTLILIPYLGLTGAAIGTLCAMIYRTVTYAYFTNKQIIKTRDYGLLKGIFLFLSTVTVIKCTETIININKADNYIDWFVYAIIVFFIVTLVTILISIIVFRRDIIGFIRLLTVKNKRKRN